MAVEDALKQLVASSPSLDLGHTTLDTEREARCGHPEVLYGAGKTPQELLEISRAVVQHHQRLLVTRATDEGLALLAAELDSAVIHERSRCVTVGAPDETELTGLVAVISAGTSDGTVAEEAAVTARFLGARVSEVRDVGVAGLHRLLAHADLMREARCLVVVAGMEGALPSVVGGLVSSPVIAVPTSVGYGASFGGIAALLAMLNSCAAGVTVVNIDNGFGAGYTAALINDGRAAAQEGDKQ
jgi:NCAIR mutase (PurE)-related protein